MKPILKSILFLCLLSFFLQSCEDEDDVRTPAQLQVNDFVWKGLNELYLWQGDVANLADDRFSSQEELNSYLEGYSNPEDLFQDLLNKPVSKYPSNAIDRFSWIVSDYTVLEQELGGITKNNGVDFRLTRVAEGSNDVVGYVRYIIPNSDASSKAIKRGDFFTSVNGTKLTVSNYKSLLVDPDSYTLDFADYNGTAFVLNGKSVALTKTVLEENPILINKVINSGGHKIAYLMYNGFYAEYDSKLNQAFQGFKNEGATDLVLDLRYNGGGSVRTSTRLASMITGQFEGKIFSKRQYNFKQMAGMTAEDLEVLNERFVKDIDGTPVNSLNLSTVYILTTSSTASASELIINGLKPYINVIQIGETTTGKNVGSVTLYDSPTFTKRNVNPNHKYAMQPLVFKISNASDFGDYTQGLVPTYVQLEYLRSYGVLGDTAEPLLNMAISKITGAAAKKVQNDHGLVLPYISDSKKINGLRNEMYIDGNAGEFIKTLK
ncbi:S41 family peptidase [Flavobacterium johnsoniae]|uniref:Peptidase S41, subfamily S41A unassigned peptidases n=1 Tax=Flavobacterium johnsoniae (strain ATCC 17061 / DSM 2064 / JCM 8514 / BCRC 14874 / CCUG 350202 / NBRC 14942 / NCIMB 11054 / UW101) TaxID=376686 RepID=A5FNT1_FLAJ1|nr:S41 family peptidase [Flavobacterium johnsoniae]ABQ03131.1 peptidase S41, subfamily S41A unassigned peptidases [Flavobacterium johnsoniae UW101]OXG01436.1 peptidase S41 [Flavobacterium johnsoniae UW101]WQG80006.1 S41 family peptidase [Flavobacterium johnsoniae UW101]SHL84313.1 C-terminal processing protease CtpA/Prc, contains a PDZ domain [Flavobacterium johnsoniae]